MNQTREPENHMYRRILIPFDNSNLSFTAVLHAINIAKRFSSEITVISVIVSNSFSRSFLDMNSHETIIEKSNLNSLKRQHYDLIKTARKHHVKITTKIIVSSHISQTLMSYIYSSNSDLVIMGTRGKGNEKRLLLGSISMQISQNSPVPVLLVK